MKPILILLIVTFSCTKLERTPSSTTSILFIGDSQTEGYLGEIVNHHLQEVSGINNVRVLGVGSSSPRHWGDSTSKHAQWLCTRKGRLNDKGRVSMKKVVCNRTEEESAFSYLNSTKPDFVAFQFLGNSMGYSQSFLTEKIGSLLSNLSEEQQCLFVTSPPYYKDLEEKNKLRLQTQEYFLKAIGSRCKTVVGVTEETLKEFSTKRDFYLSDKIHLSKKGASEFFKMIRPYLP